MENSLNYQKILEKTLEKIKNEETKPSLLLHDCCAPCASYVLEYLSSYFDITLFFYNPNIYPQEEYEKRYAELTRLVSEMPLDGNVRIQKGRYMPEEFFTMAKGLEQLPEGGERCYKCYRQRLEASAREAKEKGYDYFSTTLSISPHKNAGWINQIGKELSELTGVKYLYADFKKREGYKRSIQLSQKYGLYRQNYCGCIFSKEAAMRKESIAGNEKSM